MPRKHHTDDFKKKASVMAIKHKTNGGTYTEVAEIVGVHTTMIGKWVDAYRLGKFDEQVKKPEPKNIDKGVTLKALKEIDIRPELKSIPKAIDKLSLLVERACIRLDAIYVKMTECESIASDLENEFNGDGKT